MSKNKKAEVVGVCMTKNLTEGSYAEKELYKSVLGLFESLAECA